MSKRKILSLALTLCMVAILAVGGTLAYFTDTDSAVNVMNLGNVDIAQNEKKQDGTDFEDGVKLLPMVDGREDKTTNPVVNGFFDPKMNNVVDKIVTVTNKEGSESAYVRTILAFETNTVYNEDGTVYGDAHDVYIGVLGDFDYLNRKVIVNDVEYTLAVKVYEDKLDAGDTTAPSLKQVFMAPTAGNEISDLFGSEYTIIALSQGTQTTGFDSAEEALNEAFGDLKTIDEATLITWLSAAA